MAEVDPGDLNLLRDLERHVRLWERYGVSEITLPTEQARFLIELVTRHVARREGVEAPIHQVASDGSERGTYLH